MQIWLIEALFQSFEANKLHEIDCLTAETPENCMFNYFVIISNKIRIIIRMIINSAAITSAQTSALHLHTLQRHVYQEKWSAWYFEGFKRQRY